MPDPRPSSRREATRARTQRDIARHRRRDPGTAFWRSLALIGSVGWPIVLLATGATLLGRFLDLRWQTGVRFTLVLLTLGTSLGCVVALRSLREERP